MNLLCLFCAFLWPPPHKVLDGRGRPCIFSRPQPHKTCIDLPEWIRLPTRSQNNMRHAHLSRSFLWAVLIIALASSACQQVEPNTATASAPTAGNNGKIAITTSSEEARKEYL